MAWWLGDHIKDGKKHLNFSEFASYSLRKQYHKLEEVEEMIVSGEMPLESYRFIHTKSKLSSSQLDLLKNWTVTSRDERKNKYPEDSIVGKK